MNTIIENLDNITNINDFIENTFNHLTKRKEVFNIQYKYKKYKLTISFLENNYLLFTCISEIEYFGASIHKKDIYKSLHNINQVQNDINIISIIKSNKLSIKEFLNLNVILLYLSEVNTGDTIFEFFLNKINEKTMSNDVIKMFFKKKEDDKQDDDFSLIGLSGTSALETFNQMYRLKLKGNENSIDLTFNNGSSNYSPKLKINTKGFLLFCKSKFNNIIKLILKNNEVNDINILTNLNTNNLKHLDLSENNISDISNLAKINLERLEKLVLAKNQIEDIKCLKETKLPVLRELDLSSNFIENINILENTSWPHLKSLDLSFNQISSVELFKKASFPVLEYINLNKNAIENVFPLTKTLPKLVILILNQNCFDQLDFLPKCDFKLLKEIYFFSCKLIDITNLKDAYFPNLQTLSLPENNISDISILGSVNFPKLKKLSLYSNNIQDISPLQYANFPELTELFLYQNKISNISSIERFRFSKLTTLSLMSNQIRDISYLRNTHFNYSLETLALSKNNIKDISILSNYSTVAFGKLKELWLDFNEISNIDSLDRAKIFYVRRIKLGHNLIQKINSIERMSFYSLNEIDLNNNLINDISPLMFIKVKNLKVINLTNNNFPVATSRYTLKTLKDKGVQVIM